MVTDSPQRTAAGRATPGGDRPRGLPGQLPAIDRPQAYSILDITKWFGETSGGVRTYLTEKAAWVSTRAELRHTMVIPGASDSVETAPGRRMYRLRGPRIPTQKVYRFLLTTRSTRRIIEHERPDVIEVGSPFLVPWVTALANRRLRAPLVSFHHTSLTGVLRSSGRGEWSREQSLHRALRAYVSALGRLFARTIAASDYAAEELESLGVRRIVRVPLGADLDTFRPRDRRLSRAALAGLRLDPDRPLALYAGRLAREKMLHVVVDAWKEVWTTAGVQLVVVGDGPEKTALRNRQQVAGITWMPFIHDREQLALLHAAADVYIAPGEFETFGLAALEALASGTPVVSVARGAVVELVNRSGAGALYEPGSASGLAQAVREVVAGNDGTLSRRGRAYAEREHSWPVVFDKLLKVYREV